MRSAELKRIILKEFGQKKFYGYQVHKELKSKNIEIEISRLYRILNEMHREGLLDSTWETSRYGPRKRIYCLGEKGSAELKNILIDVIETLHKFYINYLMNLPLKINVFDEMCNIHIKGLNNQDSIGYITPKYSAVQEKVISTLHQKVPKAKIFLITKNPKQIDLKFDGLTCLEGSYENIPLKAHLLNLLVFAGIPQEKSLKAALKESYRMLKQNGRLTIVTPTVLIKRFEDPLTIGEFVEKYEHVKSGKDKFIADKI
ncbi:MAG: PadR family transcriptional regulator [Candidatus Thermoplasmatota archaeon]|nr:PadR family transcriptional regulator [Candidatus Thermoplasmatota archaeon]